MDKKILITIFIAIVLIILAGFFSYQFGLNQNKNNQQGQPNIENQNLNQANNNEIIKEQIGDFDLGAKIVSTKNGSGTTNYLYIIKDGKDKLIDSNINNDQPPYDGAFFTNLRFSPEKNYLIYDIGGWEWLNTDLYDIKKEQKIELSGLLHGNYATLNSDKSSFVGDNDSYLISCAYPGFDPSKYFAIIRLSSNPETIYFTDDFSSTSGGDYLRCYYDQSAQQAVLEYDGKIIKTYPLLTYPW